MKGVDYFSAIIWSPWAPSESPDSNNAIIGRWAEDNSTYTVTCPHQLRDMLIEMQNALHVQYDEIVQLRKKLNEAESKANMW